MKPILFNTTESQVALSLAATKNQQQQQRVTLLRFFLLVDLFQVLQDPLGRLEPTTTRYSPLQTKS